ncbi:hypothetical protein K8R66_03990 [bacterium]|nr:hypothetical protein [bacterium]
MFKLDKIFEILDKEKKEIFISRENGDLAVMMSLDKYQELKASQKNEVKTIFSKEMDEHKSFVQNEIPNSVFNKFSDYSAEVKKNIMPDNV